MGRSIDFLLPRLYLGGLTFGTFSVFPFHFPHFFIRWNIYNPDIGIVDINLSSYNGKNLLVICNIINLKNVTGAIKEIF